VESEAQAESDIAALGDLLEVQFPKDVVRELSRVGREWRGDLPLLSITASLDESSIWGATEYLRLCRPDLGRNLVVVWLEEQKAACVDIARGDRSPVVTVDLGDSASRPGPLHASLAEYLQAAAARGSFAAAGSNDPWFRQGLACFFGHMGKLAFSYDHTSGGTLPRAHLWRPYRFCVQDVVLGLTVIRHDPRLNRLEVDVFLTADIPEYERGSGCRALALILLCDAYKSGGSMEIHFTKRVEGGRVPAELVGLAGALGVPLKHPEVGGLTPRESNDLLMALSGLGDESVRALRKLEQQGRLSPAGACYALHHGVWSATELEIVLRTSQWPESILRGEHPEESWHLFQFDLFVGRTALMASYLERQLGARVHRLGDAVEELEDNRVELESSYDPSSMTLGFRAAAESVEIPWLAREDMPGTLPAGTWLRVLLRARDQAELPGEFVADLEAARKHQRAHPRDIVCVLVPADVRRLDFTREYDLAARAGIGIVVCPELTHLMDQDVRVRLKDVRIQRQ